MPRVGEDERAGTDSAATMLWAGAGAGVLLRGATWVLSSLTIGPVVGFLDLVAAGWIGDRTALFWQAVLTVVAVVAALMCGLGLRTEPDRYRWPARGLAALFVLDTVVYLAPVVAFATVDVEVSRSAWALFGAAVLGNLGLAGLSVLIMIRTARPAPVPAAA